MQQRLRREPARSWDIILDPIGQSVASVDVEAAVGLAGCCTADSQASQVSCSLNQGADTTAYYLQPQVQQVASTATIISHRQPSHQQLHAIYF